MFARDIRYGTMTISMESNIKYWIIWISCMDTCLWVVGCKKPNPRMNSCMESRVWNPPFEVGFMV